MKFNTNSELQGIFLILLASLSVAILPNSAKFAFSDGVGMMTLLFARGLIGIVLLTFLVVITRSSFFLPKALIMLSIITGLLALMMIGTLYLAIIYIDVSLSILIVCLYPLVIAIISHFRRLELVNIKQWSCIGFVLLGLCLLVFNGGGKISIIGISLSIFAMISAVIVTFCSVRLINSIGPITTTFYLNFWGLIFLLILLPFLNENAFPQSKLGWAAMAVNGVFHIGAWAFFFAGMQRIGATRASMLTSIDPVFAAIIAFLLFNQFFSPVQWFGFFLVILAIFSFEYFKQKN